MKPIANYRNRRSGGRRGSALVTSVVVVMLAAAMGAAMLQMQAGVTNRQKLATDQKRALYISEAGLSEGFMALAQGKPEMWEPPRNPPASATESSGSRPTNNPTARSRS